MFKNNCIVYNYDTFHPYAIWYPAYMFKETPDAHKVWHWWRHPLGQWIPKNSMDYRVSLDDKRLKA